MAEVIDLDVQVPISDPETGKPSSNYEARWHDLVLVLLEQIEINADYEARLDALENP